jgi:predicted HTH transcriptional regulator
MFNPFKDEQGLPKPLAALTYADLTQLADYDEGFVLEFKRDFSSTVRRKIPKIVASFSNSRGGWLIIGITDEDKKISPIPREAFDYSQAIGELCRSHVSPTPRFDMRFLANPAKP